MPKKTHFIRYFIIAAIFIIMVFIYGGTLLNMQIANADQHRIPERIVYRSEIITIPAVRGEIFDRYGVPLVTNEIVYNVIIDGRFFPRTREQLANIEYLVELIMLIQQHGDEIVPHNLPIRIIENTDGTHRFSYTMARSQNRNFDRFLSDNGISQHISPGDLVNRLAAKYGLDYIMPPEERNPKLFLTVLGISYDLDRRRIIYHQNPFTISTDISERLFKVLRENAHNFRGVNIVTEYRRVYHFPHAAPHLMGRIGRIPQELWYRYQALGYPMDAIVGLNGVEAEFESFLRGWPGEKRRFFDSDGNIVDEEYITKPIPGKNVYLTLDIMLQQVTEQSIERTVSRIQQYSQRFSVPEENGEDASAGAAVIKNPNTGEVLALATYPSYNLATFNEDWEELRDHPDSPMLNRALQGLYTPGSVFKIVTSLAALSSGNVTIDERITDRGQFTEYESYQPMCWRFLMFRQTCGHINVSTALQYSCNYFYFVIGRRMSADGDIAILNSYARQMGLGVPTGIGLGERRGIIASRERSEARAGSWRPGDTLAASIGQSEYVFTPIQMAAMLSTVLTGGTRYETQLLLHVKEFGSDEIYYAPAPVAADHIEIQSDHLNAIKLGMRDVFEPGGTGAILFADMPGLTTGGKTGTAQIRPGVSPHATIVAFAPFEEPELSVSVVIEHGSRGTWAGFVAEDVFAYYFGYATFYELTDFPAPPEEIEYDEDEVLYED